MSRLSSAWKRKRPERPHIARHQLSQWPQSLIGQFATFDFDVQIANNQLKLPEICTRLIARFTSDD